MEGNLRTTEPSALPRGPRALTDDASTDPSPYGASAFPTRPSDDHEPATTVGFKVTGCTTIIDYIPAAWSQHGLFPSGHFAMCDGKMIARPAGMPNFASGLPTGARNLGKLGRQDCLYPSARRIVAEFSLHPFALDSGICRALLSMCH